MTGGGRGGCQELVIGDRGTRGEETGQETPAPRVSAGAGHQGGAETKVKVIIIVHFKSYVKLMMLSANPFLSSLL